MHNEVVKHSLFSLLDSHNKLILRNRFGDFEPVRKRYYAIDWPPQRATQDERLATLKEFDRKLSNDERYDNDQFAIGELPNWTFEEFTASWYDKLCRYDTRWSSRIVRIGSITAFRGMKVKLQQLWDTVPDGADFGPPLKLHIEAILRDKFPGTGFDYATLPKERRKDTHTTRLFALIQKAINEDYFAILRGNNQPRQR